VGICVPETRDFDTQMDLCVKCGTQIEQEYDPIDYETNDTTRAILGGDAV
jgi:hypothetical protein